MEKLPAIISIYLNMHLETRNRELCRGDINTSQKKNTN